MTISSLQHQLNFYSAEVSNAIVKIILNIGHELTPLNSREEAQIFHALFGFITQCHLEKSTDKHRTVNSLKKNIDMLTQQTGE